MSEPLSTKELKVLEYLDDKMGAFARQLGGAIHGQNWIGELSGAGANNVANALRPGSVWLSA
jgi:hypothetical protein